MYAVLGISPNATSNELEKAARKKLFETHPDMGGDEQEFIKVRDAYLTLHTESSRLAYDMEEPQVGFCITEIRSVDADAAVEMSTRLCWWKEPWTIVSPKDIERLERWVEMLMSVAYELHWQGEIKVGLISKQSYSVFDNMALIKIGREPEKHMAYTYILWRMTHA